MVPEEFHDYFVASAGVAGALIGLLFVAISVHPEQIGEGSDWGQNFRPSAALSALLNSLLVSLVMLIPGPRAGGGVIIVAAIGIVAVAGLLVGMARRFRTIPHGSLARAIVLLLVQAWIYVVEVWQGLRLRRGADPDDPVATICTMVLILFVVGIERAWEFVGARMPGLWTILAAFRRPDGPR